MTGPSLIRSTARRYMNTFISGKTVVCWATSIGLMDIVTERCRNCVPTGKMNKCGNGVPTWKEVWELRSKPFPHKLTPGEYWSETFLTLWTMDIHYIYMASHLHVGVNVPPSQHCHYHVHNICYILCTCTNLCDTEHSEIRNVSHIDYMNTSFLQCFFFCDWSVKVSFDVHCLSNCHTLYTRLI